MGEGLTRRHQVEILIGLESEQIHHLCHHLAMLTGEHDSGGQCLASLERADHRSKLDGLRTGPQNDRDAGVIGHAITSDRRILRAFFS